MQGQHDRHRYQHHDQDPRRAAETAWKKHVGKITVACEALDDAFAGLDLSDAARETFDALRDAVREVLEDEVEEVTVDD